MKTKYLLIAITEEYLVTGGYFGTATDELNGHSAISLSLEKEHCAIPHYFGLWSTKDEAQQAASDIIANDQSPAQVIAWEIREVLTNN